MPRSYLKPFLDEIWRAQNLRCVFYDRKQPLSYTGKNVGVTLRIYLIYINCTKIRSCKYDQICLSNPPSICHHENKTSAKYFGELESY